MFCLSIAGCNYLEDYSQDLVIAKSVQDVDELLLGSGYLRYNSPDYLAYGDPCYWIHLLDDDVNSIIADRAAANNVNLLKNTYYGYFAGNGKLAQLSKDGFSFGCRVVEYVVFPD
ncbi:MAG: hypothetical protein ACLU30_15955 [Odoribacter splanchnicus]